MQKKIKNKYTISNSQGYGIDFQLTKLFIKDADNNIRFL